MDDYRQQQELEEERLAKTLQILARIDLRIHTNADVLWLASELGVSKEFTQQFERKAA